MARVDRRGGAGQSGPGEHPQHAASGEAVAAQAAGVEGTSAAMQVEPGAAEPSAADLLGSDDSAYVVGGSRLAFGAFAEREAESD